MTPTVSLTLPKYSRRRLRKFIECGRIPKMLCSREVSGDPSIAKLCNRLVHGSVSQGSSVTGFSPAIAEGEGLESSTSISAVSSLK